MRIELKHLAPYLPYELKGMSMQGTTFYLAIGNNMMGIGIENRDIGTWLSTGIKPILRPLSDLTKEQIKSLEVYNAPNFMFLRSEEHIWNYHKDKISQSNIEWCVMKNLIEWHFDVFGLIEQGLAIDINTIK